jgi:hypothetical protein
LLVAGCWFVVAAWPEAHALHPHEPATSNQQQIRVTLRQTPQTKERI